MAVTINTDGFAINFGASIDKRLIVDRADGTTSSLVSLEPNYNYRNMYVWVREEKSFYYLIDSPTEGGATFSDWTQLSIGSTPGATGCGKSGYVSGASFSTTISPVPATASVIFDTPYSSASYSVAVTSHAFDEVDYLYSVIDKTENGFTIRTPTEGPIGATAMWIANCFDGSGLSSGGGGNILLQTNTITNPNQNILNLTEGTNMTITDDGAGNITFNATVSTIDDRLINAKKVAWENDNSYPTMPGQTQSWGLTAGLDPNTVIFYNGNNAFDSPQGDIVVSLNPATATPGLNRDFKLILGNGGRVETGNTWSVAYNGTRLVEYTEGRIEPHILDFSWATSSEVPNGEYLLTKYMLESPVNDSVTTGAAYGGDFTSVKRMMGYFGSLSTPFGTPGLPDGRGGSTVFPKGSILFVNESFVTCEGITGSVTGVTISFGLTQPTSIGLYGTLINQWEPSLASFGVPHSGKIIFPDKALGDFATGSVYYSNSPVGIIRLTEPAMIVITVEGGTIAANTYLKCQVPYIVDEASINTISSGTNYIAEPSNSNNTGVGGSGSGIDITEIAYGTGTGITSSNDFRLETGNNLILSNKSSINSSNFSSIIGGACFSTITASQYSTLISSYLSSIKSSNCSSIIGSYQVQICNSPGSVIIGQYSGSIKNSNFSTNIGGGQNFIDNSNLPGSSHYGGIVFGSSNKICNATRNNSIFSGEGNLISGTFSTIDNIILGGSCNTVFGSSKYSSIVGGFTNSMTASYHSSIIGGYFNKICGGIGGGTSPVRYSSIIGGYKNRISSTFKSGTSENSVIIGGCNNNISNACNSAIIGGTGLSINAGPSNPFALENVVYVPSLKGHGSLQLQVTTSSTDIFLDDTHFTLITYPSVGGMTVSLPSANYAPNRLYIIKKDGSSTQSVVYIEPNSANPDSIDGYTGSITLENPWDYNILQSDGVNMWIKLGGAVGINL